MGIDDSCLPRIPQRGDRSGVAVPSVVLIDCLPAHLGAGPATCLAVGDADRNLLAGQPTTRLIGQDDEVGAERDILDVS